VVHQDTSTPDGKHGNEGGADWYLINTGRATAIGFKTLANIDYSQDVFNIGDMHIHQLDGLLNINQNYTIERILNIWTVIRRYLGFECRKCHLVTGRDKNAARNILVKKNIMAKIVTK
jgi:hypothetical protein